MREAPVHCQVLASEEKLILLGSVGSLLKIHFHTAVHHPYFYSGLDQKHAEILWRSSARGICQQVAQEDNVILLGLVGSLFKTND